MHLISLLLHSDPANTSAWQCAAIPAKHCRFRATELNDVIEFGRATFHAGRSNWHARDSQSANLWSFTEQSLHGVSRDVSLDDVAFDFGCVAGRQSMRNAESCFDGTQVFDVYG